MKVKNEDKVDDNKGEYTSRFNNNKKREFGKYANTSFLFEKYME
ncbi:MAG: hypothetical protein ACLTDP_00035 [Terrisporobacter sp.]